MRKSLIYIFNTSAIVIMVISATVLIDSCNLNEEWDSYYENPPEQTGENVLTMIAENRAAILLPLNIKANRSDRIV